MRKSSGKRSVEDREIVYVQEERGHTRGMFWKWPTNVPTLQEFVITVINFQNLLLGGGGGETEKGSKLWMGGC